MVKSGQHAFTLLYPFFSSLLKMGAPFSWPTIYLKVIKLLWVVFLFLFSESWVVLLSHSMIFWHLYRYNCFFFFFFSFSGITKLPMPPGYKLKGSKSWRILLFIIVDIDDTNEFKYIIISRAPMVNK